MVIRRKNLLIFGSLGLIIFGIILVAIIDRVVSSNSASDIRARAGVTKRLTANATVISTDLTKGTIVVTDLYFTEESRSSEAKNFGSWTVKAPTTFDLVPLSPGADLVIAVDASSFNVPDHTLTAASITIKK